MPPTPERLEQDKKAIDDQFERAFTLVEQLAKDTEVLKAAEQERTQRLDAALSELETVMQDLKSSNRRREDEASRVRDDVQGLKDSLPKALDSQKELTDTRLKEVNAELKSLKALIAQRMNPAPSADTASSYGRSSTPHAAPTSSGAVSSSAEIVEVNGRSTADGSKPKDYQDYVAGLTRNSPFSSGAPQSKASIPAWQMAMSTKSPAPSPSAANGSTPGQNGQEEASGSS
jgi:peroxin-14